MDICYAEVAEAGKHTNSRGWCHLPGEGVERRRKDGG